MRRERSAVVSRLALLVALAALLSAAGKPVLQTGRAGDVTLRRCTPEGYGVAGRYFAPRSKTPQEIRLTAGWLTAKERRRACLLRATIRVTIAGSNGIAASAEWKVNSVRRPWSGIAHTWIWRNWCDTGPEAEATFAVSVLGGRTVRQQIPVPPVCVDQGSPTTLTDLGTGTKHVPRSDRFRPHIIPKRAPPPLHWALINPKNGWLVSDGWTLVAVYAGSPGADPSIGRFAILRQNAIFGIEYLPPDVVDVGRVGAIKIVHPPRGRSRETTAQYGHLPFVSTNGTRGFLDLTGDRIRITHRP